MHLRATLMLSRKHPRAQLTHSQMKSVKASVSQSVSWSIGPPVPLSFRQFLPFLFHFLALSSLSILRQLFWPAFPEKKALLKTFYQDKSFCTPARGNAKCMTTLS